MCRNTPAGKPTACHPTAGAWAHPCRNVSRVPKGLEMQNHHAGGVASVSPSELAGQGRWPRRRLSEAALNQNPRLPGTCDAAQM